MGDKDKAAEALQLADAMGGYNSWGDKVAAMLREYAAMLQAQPVACLVENESAIMAWPITCLDEARTYCDEGEEPVLLYARPQPAEAGRVPLTDDEIDLLMKSIGLTLADDNDSRMANHAGWERGQRRKIARAIERHHGILPKEQPCQGAEQMKMFIKLLAAIVVIILTAIPFSFGAIWHCAVVGFRRGREWAEDLVYKIMDESND